MGPIYAKDLRPDARVRVTPVVLFDLVDADDGDALSRMDARDWPVTVAGGCGVVAFAASASLTRPVHENAETS